MGVNIIVAPLLVIAASIASLGGALEIQAQCINREGIVTVIATATNASGDTLNFCGVWRFHSEFTPGEECAARIAEDERKEAEKKALAEKEGRQYRAPCGASQPLFLCINGLPFVDGQDGYGVELAPGEAFVDSVVFSLLPTYYERCPGWAEVRCDLDLCDEAEGQFEYVPHNALGGRVTISIPVPWGI